MSKTHEKTVSCTYTQIVYLQRINKLIHARIERFIFNDFTTELNCN